MASVYPMSNEQGVTIVQVEPNPYKNGDHEDESLKKESYDQTSESHQIEDDQPLPPPPSNDVIEDIIQDEYDPVTGNELNEVSEQEEDPEFSDIQDMDEEENEENESSSEPNNDYFNQSNNQNKSNGVSIQANGIGHKSNEHFSLTFEDLSYYVNENKSFCPFSSNKKYIFRNISGELKSGELTAIMGPSGAGKSTLLDTLARKKRLRVTGNLLICGRQALVDIAYIPQQDFYYETLTCEETIMFASKLKNATVAKNGNVLAKSVLNQEEINMIKKKNQQGISYPKFHKMVTRSVLKLLGLEAQRKVKVGQLSGGQRKRMSIAQELVAKPDVLMLDEPTSGLDSTASFQCIEMLYKLTQQPHPLIIMCTIHQPNPATFALFHKVLVLSTIGKFAFNGPPNSLLETLEQQGIPCPVFYSAADYILQVASGREGPEALRQMVNFTNNQRPIISQFGQQSLPLSDMTDAPKFPNQQHFRILLYRCWIMNIRDPMLTSVRLFSHVFIALFIGWIFGSDVGTYSNCPPRLGNNFDPLNFQSLTNKTVDEVKGSLDNVSSMFFGIMIILFGAMLPTLVTFPLEMSLVLKEKVNNWYGAGSYFSARLIADTPFQIFIPLFYVIITYYLNSQPQEIWRFINYASVFTLTALISQCHGVVVGTLFHKNITTAVYLGPISSMPFLLLSGFLVRVQRMPAILQPLTWLSFLRFSFEGVLLSIYGNNRCGDDSAKEITRMRVFMLDWFNRILSIVQNGGDCFDESEEDFSLSNNTKAEMQVTSNSSLQLNQMRDTLNEFLLINQTDLSSAKSAKLQDNPIATSMVNFIMTSFAGNVDKNGKIQPRVLEVFELNDSMLTQAILVLIFYFILYRIISYFIIKWKASQHE